MLILDLHSCGINLRYIGEVRYYVLNAEAVLERSERTKATDELCGPEREKGGEKRDVKSEEKNRREGERQGLLTMGSLQVCGFVCVAGATRVLASFALLTRYLIPGLPVPARRCELPPYRNGSAHLEGHNP